MWLALSWWRPLHCASICYFNPYLYRKNKWKGILAAPLENNSEKTFLFVCLFQSQQKKLTLWGKGKCLFCQLIHPKLLE